MKAGFDRSGVWEKKEGEIYESGGRPERSGLFSKDLFRLKCYLRV